MKLHSLLFRSSLLLFVIALMLAAPRASAQAQNQAQTDASVSQASALQTPAVPARITQAIDETQLVTLKGNVHPLARPEFDQGAVEDSMPVTRAFLLLQRSAEQETALRQLLDEQQYKGSPNYHAWLTPEQFGKQFGPADSDIAAVTGWLTGHGFHDVKVGAGRMLIEFSGNVGQVRNAFHTDVRSLSVYGKPHLANMNDPQIPAALAPVITGIVGLHDFRPKSLLHQAKNFHPESATAVGKAPSVTLVGGCGSTCYVVAPADFAKIYGVPATVNGNPPGTGVTIAIVQDSNVNVSDVQQFRTLFGLTGSTFTASNVILNGPDPGVGGDEMEAVLDSEWSGAVAPGATIKVVVTEAPQTLGAQGIDLSADYIIENNIAPIMSESFGSCETASGVAAFYGALWEQAAAQGITVVVSTGDSGSDVCDVISTNNDFATTGLSNSGIASTPFNIALGGTDFQNGPAPSPFWLSPGTATESAKSYIPESTWNNSCAAGATSGTLNSVCTAAIISRDAATFADISGGSGGQSAISTNLKPSWQTGISPASDTHRDIPDISLFSAVNTSSNSFYIICQADSQTQNGNACNLTSGQAIEITGVGGTSAAAPAFAGMMAAVVQQQGGEPTGRQGNANFVLYQLYKKNLGNATTICPSNAANVATTTCIFYDVITGNNSVACAGGTANCSNTNGASGQYGVLVDPSATTTPAYAAVAGYDKATGLGSVNETNLLKAWTSATFTADTTKITSSPSGPIAHGSTANFTVTVTSASGTPQGNISLVATPSGGKPAGIGSFTNNGSSSFTLSGGSVTISTNLLPGGTDSVVAQYSGDGTFAPGQSAPVNVTVNKETSKTAVSLVGPAGNSTPYGSAYILRVDVTNSSSQQCSTTAVPCPTGQVSMTNNGNALNDFSGSNTTSLVNDLGFFEDQFVQLPGGTNNIVATYAGDASYSGSTSPTLSVTITPATTATTVAANPASGVTTSTSVALTANIATTSNGNGPTGSVAFSANGTSLGTANVVPTAATSTVAAFGTATLAHTFSTANTYTISATYTTGDGNYSNSASSGAGNATITVTGSTSTPTITSLNPTSGAVGTSVTITGTNFGTAQGTSTVKFNGTTATPTTWSATSIVAPVPTGATTGNVVVTVGGTASNGVTFTVTTGGTFTVSGAVVTVAAGSNGMSNITVTPSGGFTGIVNVTCPTASNSVTMNFVPGVTCSPNPLAINIVSASPVASNLTIAVAAPSSSLSASAAPLDRKVYAAALAATGGANGWWGLSAGAGLAAIVLLALPGRRRYRASLALASVCVLSIAMGCGGGYGGNGGPSSTTTKISVTSTKVASGTSISFTVNVTSTGTRTPTGSVQLYDATNTLGTSMALANGSATIPISTLSVGTHAISAHYMADAYSQASQSGALNMAITGSTTLGIIGTSGGTTVNGTASLTIN